MPRASPAKHKQRAAAKAHAASTAVPLQPVAIAQPPVVQELRPVTPTTRTRKRVVRRPKYHEATTFLERESFKGLALSDGLPPPGPESTWFPGATIGEAYRVASTMFRAAHQASLETRPVSWGYGSSDGALGHHTTRRVVEMKPLAAFRRSVVRSVSAGNRLSLFLTEDSRVFQAGRLFLKQDGCAMWRPVEVKTEAEGWPSSGARIVAVAAGHLAAYALDDQGRVYSWGSQIFGQLGHGEELEEETAAPSESPDGGEARAEDEDPDAEEEGGGPSRVVVEKTPRLVEGLTAHSVVKLSAGNHFVVALSATGAVFSWGRGCFGQLGSGEPIDKSSPARIDALQHYVALDIAAGTAHVLGVFVPREGPTSNQSEVLERTVLMAWGRGRHGCLGLGGSANELLPRENEFFRGLGASKVAAGADHSLALCRAGARTFLYAFGGNELGQLGVASGADHVDMPSFVDEFANVHVAEIGAGVNHSAALTGDGEVFSWGDARYGKTCRVDARTTFVPWKADLPSEIPSSSFVTQLSVGAHHSLAQLRIGGEVDRWRKFPLGGVVSAVGHDEPTGKVSTCQCKSSQTVTQCVLGICVQCETCRAAPLCRACARRCHAGHLLRPTAIGRALQRRCTCSEGSATSCKFAAKLQPVIPEET